MPHSSLGLESDSALHYFFIPTPIPAIRTDFFNKQPDALSYKACFSRAGRFRANSSRCSPQTIFVVQIIEMCAHITSFFSFSCIAAHAHLKRSPFCFRAFLPYVCRTHERHAGHGSQSLQCFFKSHVFGIYLSFQTHLLPENIPLSRHTCFRKLIRLHVSRMYLSFQTHLRSLTGTGMFPEYISLSRHTCFR